MYCSLLLPRSEDFIYSKQKKSRTYHKFLKSRNFLFNPHHPLYKFLFEEDYIHPEGRYIDLDLYIHFEPEEFDMFKWMILLCDAKSISFTIILDDLIFLKPTVTKVSSSLITPIPHIYLCFNGEIDMDNRIFDDIELVSGGFILRNLNYLRDINEFNQFVIDLSQEFEYSKKDLALILEDNSENIPLFNEKKKFFYNLELEKFLFDIITENNSIFLKKVFNESYFVKGLFRNL